MSIFGGGGSTDVKPTAEEKALATDAAVKFNDYQLRYVPLENSFISELTPSSGDVTRLRGSATTDVEQAAKGSDRAAVAGSGGAFGQGRTVLTRAGMASNRGIARGMATAGADMSGRQQELAGKTKMAAFGRNLQNDTTLSLSNAARISSQAAINEVNGNVAARGNTMDMLGTAAGTGLGVYSAWGGGKTAPANNGLSSASTYSPAPVSSSWSNAMNYGTFS